MPNISSQDQRQLIILLQWIINCIDTEDMDQLRLGLPDWLDRNHELLN